MGYENIKYDFGIYDSGIGGITTLCAMSRAFPNLSYYYLADNYNMPLGEKKTSEVENIVNQSLSALKQISNRQIFACNTASTTVKNNKVIKLLPQLFKCEPNKTLLLATPLTLKNLKGSINDFHIADTPELAKLIEVQADICYRFKTELNMNTLLPYLEEKLESYLYNDKYDIENIILGCSHYIYITKELSKMFPKTNLFTGNTSVVDKVKQDSAKPSLDIKSLFSRNQQNKQINLYPTKKVAILAEKTTDLSFNFTGKDESQKYSYLYYQLICNNFLL